MEDLPIALERAAAATLPSTSVEGARTHPTPRTCLFRGRDAVAGMSGMLNDLSLRTGQAGAMHWLRYRLSMPARREKIPILVLVGLDSSAKAAEVRADDVLGAVLLYEYTLAGFGVRIFATEDATGRGTVIAPAHMRAQVSEAAAQALVKRGALTAMITFEAEGEGKDQDRSAALLQSESGQWEMARRNRSVPRDLPLAETHEATLIGLGQHTRRNLRYYRRRLERDFGAVFVPVVAMGREEFLAINRASTNPVSDLLAAWRYDSTRQMQGTVFAGVRARDGRWLSLIGGRRHMQVTDIDWQINLAGLPRYSLSTVMRSYIVQHEVELGTKKLAFTGGTPHSIRHSFACVDAGDVIAVRRSPAGWLLRRLSRWLFPKNNLVGEALRDRKLRWSR